MAAGGLAAAIIVLNFIFNPNVFSKSEQMACFSPAVEFPGFLHPGADKDYSINPKLSIAVARNCISIGNSIALIEKRDRSFTCSSILRHA